MSMLDEIANGDTDLIRSPNGRQFLLAADLFSSAPKPPNCLQIQPYSTFLEWLGGCIDSYEVLLWHSVGKLTARLRC